MHGPEDYRDELLNVEWGDEEENEDGEKEPGFALYTDSGYRRKSGITGTEDVSYVSSPYLPDVLRGSDEPTNDNTSRAHESAAGASGIQDELSEAIQLDTVRIMVGEWIPFGSNQIVALNEKLGSADRCQGGMFTGSVDEESGGTKLALPPVCATFLSFLSHFSPFLLLSFVSVSPLISLIISSQGSTSVRILDYDETTFINFEVNFWVVFHSFWNI